MTRTSNTTLGGVVIFTILILSMLIRCTAPENQAQMEKDIAGLTQQQRDAAIAPMQQELYPGSLP